MLDQASAKEEVIRIGRESGREGCRDGRAVGGGGGGV
jgi:hypothetical protein